MADPQTSRQMPEWVLECTPEDAWKAGFDAGEDHTEVVAHPCNCNNFAAKPHHHPCPAAANTSPPEGPKPTGTIFELDLFRERLEREAASFTKSGEHSDLAFGDDFGGNYDDAFMAGSASMARTVGVQLKDLAAELKTLIDNCMKQYATPQPAQLGGSEGPYKCDNCAAPYPSVGWSARHNEIVVYRPSDGDEWKCGCCGIESELVWKFDSWRHMNGEPDRIEQYRCRECLFAQLTAANSPAPTGGGDEMKLRQIIEGRMETLAAINADSTTMKIDKVVARRGIDLLRSILRTFDASQLDCSETPEGSAE